MVQFFACNVVYLMVFFSCHGFVALSSEVTVSDEFRKCCSGKYMIMSPNQIAGRSHNLRTDSSTSDMVEDFK